MDSFAYKSFVAVVEQRTITEAAAYLHTTQPTLTRQIQQLERNLGVALFDRVGKRLVLTRAGGQVYRYALEFLRAETKMLDELGELSDPEQGIIRLGAGLTPSIYRLPTVLSAYRQDHPLVRFQLVTGSSKAMMERLDAREIEVAIVTTPPDEVDSLELLPLWHDELCVVAPMGHPLVGGGCTLAEFASMPMVLMRSDSGLRRQVEQRLASAPNPLHIVMETDSLEAMNRFVQVGLGLAVMPYSAVRDDVLAGRLSTVALSDVELGARTITAVWRLGLGVSAATSAFVRALPELAAQAERGELS